MIVCVIIVTGKKEDGKKKKKKVTREIASVVIEIEAGRILLLRFVCGSASNTMNYESISLIGCSKGRERGPCADTVAHVWR